MATQRAVAGQGTRPSLRDEQKVLTRQRVLDAAVAVFSEKAFLDATMDDIARAGGVTRATVYAHFPGGKSDMVQALVARVYESIDEAYAGLAGSGDWTRTGLRAWIEALVTRWRELTPAIRVLTTAGTSIARESTDSGDRYLAAHKRYVALLADDVRRWPHTPAPEARQRALMAVLQVESFLTLWLSGGWPVETADPLDLLTDAVCHLLAPALRR
jgi:AcrR family transcriptional regulator